MTLHGRRLDALWKLSNNTALSEEDMTRALLTIAGAAIRPGQPFAAQLLRVDVDVFHVEETISRGPHASWLPNTGHTIDVMDSLFRDIAHGGGIRSCPDVTQVPEYARLTAGRDTGTRSFIASGFRAGDVGYVVALVSTQTSTPFDDVDVHFMESLTALLSRRLERRVQRARLLARAHTA